MELGLSAVLVLLLVGLAAGVMGGLLGVGGSTVMIPAMVILFGQDRVEGMNQHLYQAAAMAVNVAVAVPAAWRHRKAGAIQLGVLKWMLPAAMGFIVIGVLLSNVVSDPMWLGRLLALFLLYVIYVNVKRLLPGKGTKRGGDEGVSLPSQLQGAERGKAIGVGGVMGTVAGLLGVGGGALGVPLQQVWLGLPLRACIANSSAVICFTAGFGAVLKMSTLPAGSAVSGAVLIAVCLAPTAIVGGLIGATLTHRLPLRLVRCVFVVLMVVAAWRMAELPI